MLATRKEKAKISARKRRSEETDQLQILTEHLPYAKGTIRQLDKASIVRLIVSLLKYQEAAGRDCSHVDEAPKFNFIEALNGFLIVLDKKFKILYISNSVFQHIQIPQLDMVGTNILNFIHPDDQNEFEKKFQQLFNFNCEMNGNFRHVSFTLRMHYKWNSKLRNGKISHKFKVVQISGCVVPSVQAHTNSDYKNVPFIAIAQPILPAVHELPLSSNTFVLKCGLDYRISFCEKKIEEYFNYSVEDIVGRCYYDFIHPEDVMIVQTAHQDFLRFGKSCSASYRFLNKNGGWVELVTTATTLTKTEVNCNGEDEMLCINYIHSCIEHRGLIEHECPKRHEYPKQTKKKRRALKKEENESKDDNNLITSNKMFVSKNNNRLKSQTKADNKEMNLNSNGQELCINLNDEEVSIEYNDREICFDSGDQKISVCANNQEIPVKSNYQEVNLNSHITSNGRSNLAEIKMDTQNDIPLFTNMPNIKIDETATLSPVYTTLSNREKTPICSTLLKRENDDDLSVAMTEKNNMTDCSYSKNISDRQRTNFDMHLNNDSLRKTSLDLFDSAVMGQLHKGLSLPEIQYNEILPILDPLYTFTHPETAYTDILSTSGPSYTSIHSETTYKDILSTSGPSYTCKHSETTYTDILSTSGPSYTFTHPETTYTDILSTSGPSYTSTHPEITYTDILSTLCWPYTHPETTYTDIFATSGPSPSNRNPITEYHHMNKGGVNRSRGSTNCNHPFCSRTEDYIYHNSQ